MTLFSLNVASDHQRTKLVPSAEKQKQLKLMLLAWLNCTSATQARLEYKEYSVAPPHPWQWAKRHFVVVVGLTPVKVREDSSLVLIVA